MLVTDRTSVLRFGPNRTSQWKFCFPNRNWTEQNIWKALKDLDLKRRSHVLTTMCIFVLFSSHKGCMSLTWDLLWQVQNISCNQPFFSVLWFINRFQIRLNDVYNVFRIPRLINNSMFVSKYRLIIGRYQICKFLNTIVF